MAISFTKPIINTTPPEPPINKAEADRIRNVFDDAINSLVMAIDSLVTVSNADTLTLAAMGGASVQHVASGASLAELTAGATYKYLVLTYGATYGEAVSGTGTGTAVMALTASANTVVMYWIVA